MGWLAEDPVKAARGQLGLLAGCL